MGAGVVGPHAKGHTWRGRYRAEQQVETLGPAAEGCVSGSMWRRNASEKYRGAWLGEAGVGSRGPPPGLKVGELASTLNPVAPPKGHT